MTISAVLIVKNEEVLLGRCLDSVKDADEIIICDTGSTDSTVEIAKKYTDKVYTDYTWNDDFAEARNYAKSKATGDWILSIDADETLVDFSKVREAVELAEKDNEPAVGIKLTAEDNGQTFYYPRLFKNIPEVYWENPVHNTLSVTGKVMGDVNIIIGFSPAHANDPDRAFRILQKAVKEKNHPRMMYYLGREYWYRKDYEACIQMLGRYVQQDAFLAEKADGFLMMARCYWHLGRGEDARDACLQALKINATFKEACNFMAVIVGEGSGRPQWEANAAQWRRMAETATNENVLFVREQ